MKRVVPALVVFALAGLVYVLLTEDDIGGEATFGPDPLDTMLDDPPVIDHRTAGGPGEAPSIAIDPGGTANETPTEGVDALPLRIAGRVVDERRQPVAGAKVELRHALRRRGTGATDAVGRFEIAASGLAGRHVLLVASTDDGRSATAPVYVPPGRLGVVTVPPIALAPVADLSVRVVRDGAGVEGAIVVIARRASGAPTPLATHRTGASGHLTVGAIPAGPIEVFASAPGAGRGHLRLEVPQGDAPVPEVELAGERTLAVKVEDAFDGRPIQGAEVLVGDVLGMPEPDGPGYLPPIGQVRTNDLGRATVRIGAGDTVYVNARASGYVLAPWWRHQQRGVPPDQPEVVVALHKHRRVQFLIGAGEVAPPPEGTALEVELDPHAQRTAATGLGAAIENEMLVVHGLPHDAVRGVVRAAGAQATFTAPARVGEGPMVTFRGERTVTVRLVDDAGVPAPDILVLLKPTTHSAPIDPRTTDADGRATFTGVGADDVTVHRMGTTIRGGSTILGRLDLRSGKDEYELTLRPTATLRVKIRIDGEARLPASFVLGLDGRTIEGEELEEDPGAGLLVATFPYHAVDRAVAVRFTADGYLPAAGSIEPAEGAEHELEFDLRAAATLLVVVTPPADGPFALALQTRQPDGTWQHAPAQVGGDALPRPQAPAARPVRHRYEGLASGVFRVMDTRSQVASDPVEVGDDAGAYEARLDLSTVTWVEGRVEAPVGSNLRRARVLVVDRDQYPSPWSGAAVQADGTFRLRGARGKPLELTVSHPTLRPATTGGRVIVQPGAGTVVLRLEAGGEVRFRVHGLVESDGESASVRGGMRVFLFTGKVGGDPLRVIQPLVEGDVFRFGGVETGTYTVWLSFAAPYAPKTVEGVRITDGLTDLGTVVPDRGSTLNIRPHPSDAGVRIWVTALRLGEPSYSRSASQRGDAGDVVCAGLGPGRFKVTVRAAGGHPAAGSSTPLYEEDLDIDGKSDREIVVRIP
jgi:hypothetical protein